MREYIRISSVILALSSKKDFYLATREIDTKTRPVCQHHFRNQLGQRRCALQSGAKQYTALFLLYILSQQPQRLSNTAYSFFVNVRFESMSFWRT